jgi:hypothetical protein
MTMGGKKSNDEGKKEQKYRLVEKVGLITFSNAATELKIQWGLQ